MLSNGCATSADDTGGTATPLAEWRGFDIPADDALAEHVEHYCQFRLRALGENDVSLRQGEHRADTCGTRRASSDAAALQCAGAERVVGCRRTHLPRRTARTRAPVQVQAALMAGITRAMDGFEPPSLPRRTPNLVKQLRSFNNGKRILINNRYCAFAMTRRIHRLRHCIGGTTPSFSASVRS